MFAQRGGEVASVRAKNSCMPSAGLQQAVLGIAVTEHLDHFRRDHCARCNDEALPFCGINA
ncbi:hypothetical protein ALP29_201376 [Pseudomonas syringae pv. avii]|uniref:Uncharacterized protein n=1 Tax=Pseudomonas syringae pv. avii TaxID=663959 RepID=A0A3M5UAE4_PSESX|nr:hypothetical protein ALP29_201376 [Pseudomonas syringae pv. avii]